MSIFFKYFCRFSHKRTNIIDFSLTYNYAFFLYMLLICMFCYNIE